MARATLLSLALGPAPGAFPGAPLFTEPLAQLLAALLDLGRGLFHRQPVRIVLLLFLHPGNPAAQKSRSPEIARGIAVCNKGGGFKSTSEPKTTACGEEQRCRGSWLGTSSTETEIREASVQKKPKKHRAESRTRAPPRLGWRLAPRWRTRRCRRLRRTARSRSAR